MTHTILISRNEGHGFFNTIRHSAGIDQQDAWNLAMAAILEATGSDAAGVRDFLDGTHGRHFADEVADHLYRRLDLGAAIAAAVDRWQAWTISRKTSRDTGIPEGLPYLTGFVAHYEILAEG